MKFFKKLEVWRLSKIRRENPQLEKLFPLIPLTYTYENGWTICWFGHFFNYYNTGNYRFVYATKNLKRAWEIWPRN